MKQVEALVLRHFELVVVLVLVLATAFAVLFAANKMAFLNFFYTRRWWPPTSSEGGRACSWRSSVC